MPTVAVLPMLRDHGLPEEDAVPQAGARRAGPRVVVLCAPHASNLDEFEPLRAAAVSLSARLASQAVSSIRRSNTSAGIIARSFDRKGVTRA